MSQDDDASARLRWARLRFSIIGPLLASPPEVGQLAGRIAVLAATSWRHPTTGGVLRYSAKTIERMYYAARGEADPFRAQERKVPSHAGTHPGVSESLAGVLATQYDEHPGWSYQLHHDNLRVRVKQDPSLGPMPGYATVRRFMKDRGMLKNTRRRGKGSETEVVPRETRSYEVAHVNALWHYDYHVGKRQVLTASGERKTPYLFGALDDCSRVCCHAQWYLNRENTEELVHGLSQGFQKRKVPRRILRDNGAPMKAAETVEGCERLGILQYLTLPYSPALSRSLFSTSLREETSRGDVGFRGVLRSRRHGLFRTTRRAFEREEAHIGSIVQELACQVGDGHRLEGHPDAIVKGDVHSDVGSSNLVRNVVAGDFLFELLIPGFYAKGRTDHRSDVVANERYTEGEERHLGVAERRDLTV